ncbi:hypothetical protein MRB53_020606 [Persea americana]|uniref:Uncharacterized protein n=1 Tax=Persea americana TaxID=3435 RepID=A0ACC2L2N0_PERAE|nr:hypothetical protein MRB53_020606 [Persea americana]
MYISDIQVPSLIGQFSDYLIVIRDVKYSAGNPVTLFSGEYHPPSASAHHKVTSSFLGGSHHQCIILVATINCTGAAFQLIYIIIFIIYVKKAKKGEDGCIIGGSFLVYLHSLHFLA